MSKQKLAKAESSCRLKAGAFSGGCLMVKLVLLGWKETAGLSGILTLCATGVRGLASLCRGLCVTFL